MYEISRQKSCWPKVGGVGGGGGAWIPRNYLAALCLMRLVSSESATQLLWAYTPFWLVNGVSSSNLLSEVLSALAFLNLFMQKMIAYFSKLPMLKSTLDHLNSSRESNASWCTAAVTAVLNLETEHGITINGSWGPTVRKSPPLSVQQFLIQVAIPCLDTLIVNIIAASQVRKSSLLSSQPLYSTQLFLLMMQHFSELMVNLSCQPWLTSMGKKQRYHLKGLHILILLLSIKKNC